MIYYKIIQQNNIVGAGISDNLFCFQPRNYVLLRTNVDQAQYLECEGTLYHATWMKPITSSLYSYEDAIIVTIDEQEYLALVSALDINKQIEIIETEEEEENSINEESTDITLEFIKSSKIKEMSRTCNQIIEAGFDIELSGETHHFSLTTQDQLNLISLQGMLGQGMQQVPYHADGEICRFYTAAEMDAIIAAATAFKIYHTTYYNALKNYINSLNTIEDIAAITYGVELPEEYQSDVLKTLL